MRKAARCIKCKVFVIIPKDAILECEECPVVDDRKRCAEYEMGRAMCPRCQATIVMYCIKKKEEKSDRKPDSN